MLFQGVVYTELDEETFSKIFEAAFDGHVDVGDRFMQLFSAVLLHHKELHKHNLPKSLNVRTCFGFQNMGFNTMLSQKLNHKDHFACLFDVQFSGRGEKRLIIISASSHGLAACPIIPHGLESPSDSGVTDTGRSRSSSRSSSTNGTFSLACSSTDSESSSQCEEAAKKSDDSNIVEYLGGSLGHMGGAVWNAMGTTASGVASVFGPFSPTSELSPATRSKDDKRGSKSGPESSSSSVCDPVVCKRHCAQRDLSGACRESLGKGKCECPVVGSSEHQEFVLLQVAHMNLSNKCTQLQQALTASEAKVNHLSKILDERTEAVLAKATEEAHRARERPKFEDVVKCLDNITDHIAQGIVASAPRYHDSRSVFNVGGVLLKFTNQEFLQSMYMNIETSDASLGRSNELLLVMLKQIILKTTKLFDPSQQELAPAELNKRLASLLSAILANTKDGFCFPPSILVQLVTKLKTNSPQMVDLLSQAIHGGVSDNIMDARMNQIAKNVQDNEKVNLDTRDVEFAYDNFGDGSGKNSYKKSSEADANFVSAIFTGVAEMKSNEDGLEKLQLCPSMSPLLWKPKSWLKGTHGSLFTLYGYNGFPQDNDDEGNRIPTHKELHQKGILERLVATFKSDVFDNEEYVLCCEQTKAREYDNTPIVCTYCRLRHTRGTKHCDGCHSVLAPIGEQDGHKKSGETNLRHRRTYVSGGSDAASSKQRIACISETGGDIVISTNSYLDETIDKSTGEKSLDFVLKDDPNPVDVDDELKEWTVLTSQIGNPASEEVIRQIWARIAVRARLINSPGLDMTMVKWVRSYIVVHADIGAMLSRILDAAREGSDDAYLAGIVYFIGRWHEIKNLVEDVSDVFLMVGGRPLLPVAGWISEPQQKMLLDGGKQRATRNFFRNVLLSAAFMAIRYEAIQYYVETDSREADSITILDVYSYMQLGTSGSGDIHFENMMFFFGDLLGSMDDMISGARSNGYDMCESGRLFDLPYKFCFHRNLYASQVQREIAITHFLSDARLRDRRRRNESIGCLSMDERMEYQHKQLHSCHSSANATAESVLIASAFQQWRNPMLLQLAEIYNKPSLSPRSSVQRRPADCSPRISAVCNVLITSRTFQFIDGRQDCYNITMTKKVHVHNTPCVLYSLGKERMLSYADAWLDDLKPKFPAGVEVEEP